MLPAYELFPVSPRRLPRHLLEHDGKVFRIVIAAKFSNLLYRYAGVLQQFSRYLYPLAGEIRAEAAARIFFKEGADIAGRPVELFRHRI